MYRADLQYKGGALIEQGKDCMSPLHYGVFIAVPIT